MLDSPTVKKTDIRRWPSGPSPVVRVAQFGLGALCTLTACGALPTSAPADAERLAAELARRPGVLLGEVHDNVGQHGLRAEALRRLLANGARPAIAFEQFDRERQPDIDRARRERPPAGGSLADHVIAQARAPKDNWDWPQYRRFLELALQFDLPIVAANLSRADASRVAREGVAAVFAEPERRRLGLDRIDDALQSAHERIAQTAHCNLLPTSALPGLARAQIARDAVLAQALRLHLAGGVVLLTGNGHVRRDVGVPRHLTADERSQTWSIGLLEQGTDERAKLYDVAFLTPEQPRADPCAQLKPRSS